MHMQDGIGRNGYRWLGSVFFGIGLLGLLTTWYAFNQAKQDAGLYDWLGFCLTAAALMALYATMLVLLARSSSAPTVSFKAARPEGVPAEARAPPKAEVAVPEAQPDNDPAIEFNDAIAVGPETVVPVRGAPGVRGGMHGQGSDAMAGLASRTIAPLPRATPVAQPNRNLGMDTKGWPERRGPSGITRREMMEQLRSREDPVQESRVPTILAKPANGMARNDGTSRGKCGGCGASLLAPSQRPVNIKCPRCDKVTLIQ